MASTIRSCSVDGCNRKYQGSGFCNAHWQRWKKTGFPGEASIRSQAPTGEPLAFAMKQVADFKAGLLSSDCIIWPYGRGSKGYGVIWTNGASQKAHRVILNEITPLPSPDLQACHSCGHGHLGCVNPEHLRWGTAKANGQDRVLHGTSRRGTKNHKAKLDEEQVLSIYIDNTRSQRTLAADYGVSQVSISLIKRCINWGWLTSGI